ncbi:hypothetical protein U1Q18_024524 [Sarracenia purpurea var. burkii]
MKKSILTLLRTAVTASHIHQIHAQLITTTLISVQFNASRFLDSLTSIVSDMSYAELVFAQTHQPNTFMWNTIIRGYLSISEPQLALHFYIEMRRNGLLGDNYTYPLVLKACGMKGGFWEGRGVHGEVVKAGFKKDLFVRNGLIGMYCKSEDVGCARLLFDAFYGKDMVSWNLMLNGYVGNGEVEEARKLFDEMPERDVISWSIMIDGYGKVSKL